jgi:hypothetical protein
MDVGQAQTVGSDPIRGLALPLAILVVPMILSVVSAGEWLTATFPLALVIGAVLRPRWLWPLWLGSTVLMWAVYGYATYVLHLMPAPGQPGAGETVWTFALESAIFMAGLVLLPLWLGRRGRPRVTRQIDNENTGAEALRPRR